MIERYQTQKMKDLFADARRFEYMLQVEKTVAEAQAQKKIIPRAANADIQRKSRIDLQRIFEIEKLTKHDVIAFVSQVSETIGPNGKYLHYGLTSSDVLDTALSLQVRDGFMIVLSAVGQLKTVIRRLALKHKSSLCAGRTHGIFAELTTFGFKLMGYLSELSRCEKRLTRAKEQFEICKLSGAVGTSSALDLGLEKAVAQKLKLKVEPFATQVIPRDRHAEVFTALAFLALFLERLSIELRHLQRTEVDEVIEGFDPGQKGSSAMPHKKNPISAENITGLARLIRGYASVSMDNVPLWHERDISHSSNERILFQDAFTLSHYVVERMTTLLKGIYVDQKQMLENTLMKGGILYTSHLLNHLISNHRMPREKAYGLMQKASFELKSGELLSEKILNSPELSEYFSRDILEKIFSGRRHVEGISRRIKVYGDGL